MTDVIARVHQAIARPDKPNVIVMHVDDAAWLCDRIDTLEKALREAVSTIEDYTNYQHDGDPWTEDARAMGEMDINEYATDGRLEAARAIIALIEGEQT